MATAISLASGLANRIKCCDVRLELFYAMKEILFFRFHRSDGHRFGSGLTLDCFNSLISRYPQGRVREDYFRMDLEVGSEEYTEFLKFLAESNGPMPNMNIYPHPDYRKVNMFLPRGERIFSKVETDSAEFFVIFCRDIFTNSNTYDDSGEMLIPTSDMKKNGIGCGNQLEILCHSPIKELILGQEFVGISFRKPRVVSKRKAIHPDVWQFWPTEMLPPMKSPKCDGYGNVVDIDDDNTDQCYMRDVFLPRLFVYEKDVIYNIIGIDFMRTCEHL